MADGSEMEAFDLYAVCESLFMCCWKHSVSKKAAPGIFLFLHNAASDEL